jgi:nucleotide-binding universal stress UspA family protein
VQLAAEHGGTLMVMHAIPPLLPIHGRPVPPPATELTTLGRHLAAAVARAVKHRRLRRVRSWVMVGPPAGCILEAAKRADAIVMGTLGRTGLPHLLLGSVAERVVRHASVPVLTVRTKAGRAR